MKHIFIISIVIILLFVLVLSKSVNVPPINVPPVNVPPVNVPPININVKVPKFVDDFTTSYSTFDNNGKVVVTAPLPNGVTSPIQLSTGALEINIKEVSTGKIVSTYNYRGTTGVALTLDTNNILNLPSTIVTIINNIPKQITIN